MSFCFSKARINSHISHPFHCKTLTSLHCVLQLFTLSNLTKLPYWSPHYARNRSGSYWTPWPSRKWHLPRSPYPLPEPLVEWSHGGAGSESKSWNLSWQQPHEHNASKVLEKAVEKIQRAQILSDSRHLAYCLLWKFGTSFWWTVSAYKTTCLNRPLNRKNIKTGTPAQAYRPPISWMYQSVSNGARLPPQLTINTVPCQVSSMYDVTSTCLNMLAWTPSNTYHTSGRVKGDDTGKLCDVQAPVLLVVLLAKQFVMPFPQALQAHWNVDSRLNCIQGYLITDSPLHDYY